MSSSVEKESVENIKEDSKKESDENEKSNKLDESRLQYENGKCFYKDPVTEETLEWSEEKQEWVRVNQPNPKDYFLKDGCYHYNDKLSGKQYKWDNEANSWTVTNDSEPSKNSGNIKTVENDEEKEDENGGDDEEEEFDEGKSKKMKLVVRQDMSEGIYGTDGENHTYTDPNDGTVYVWDKEKNAWFPKIDDDFLAQYQMSYGFIKPDPSDSALPESKVQVDSDDKVRPKEDSVSKPEEKEDSTLKRKLPQEPTWFEVGDEHNTKVYVSNLPTDITEQEFIDLMQKCGLVMKDVETGKMKIKLYTEPGSDMLKGDALCTYIKVESVELALNLLDGYDVRGHKIHVERAKFTMKGSSYDPTLKPRKKRRKDKEKIKKMQEKLFDWRPDKLRGERAKHERIVIIKNLFDPSIFDNDVGLILEYQQDIRDECIKCGDVRKVTIYDRHPEGVAQVIFKEAEAADACVQLLNNRWFGQRRISAETWDGKTKYKIIETEEEKEARLKKWEKFLKDSEKSQEDAEEMGSDVNKNIEKNDGGEDEESKVAAENKSSSAAADQNDRGGEGGEATAGSDSDETRSSAGSHDETDDED